MGYASLDEPEESRIADGQAQPVAFDRWREVTGARMGDEWGNAQR